MKGHVFNFRKRKSEYNNIRKLSLEKKHYAYNDKQSEEAESENNKSSTFFEVEAVSNATKIIDFTKSNILILVFALTILAGIVWGSSAAKNADSSLTLSLDFLFATNLEARLLHGFFETFCACFASNFVFITLVFLLGLTPWGCFAIPLVTFFKGFGIGLCAGYLYISYGLKGIAFYLLVLLVGLFIFAASLTFQSKNSFLISKKYFKISFFKNAKIPAFDLHIKEYCLKTGQMLILATFAALVDSTLWVMLTPLFKF